MLTFLREIVALDPEMPTQVFTAPTLVHLRRLPAGCGTGTARCRYNQTLLWLLSDLMADGPTMVARILAAGALQALVPVVPVPPALSGGVDDDSKLGLWTLACDMLWALHNALTVTAQVNTTQGAVARKLHKCGAFRYCTWSLVAAAQFTTSQPLYYHLLHNLRIMISTGDTDGDPTVLTEVTEPRNVFLSSFFADGGHNALLKLLQDEAVPVDTRDLAVALRQLVDVIVGDVTDAAALEARLSGEDIADEYDGYQVGDGFRSE